MMTVKYKYQIMQCHSLKNTTKKTQKIYQLEISIRIGMTNGSTAGVSVNSLGDLSVRGTWLMFYFHDFPLSLQTFGMNEAIVS